MIRGMVVTYETISLVPASTEILPYLPDQIRTGRPITYPRREIVNAIRDVLRTGSSWRKLPHDLPPWRIVVRRDGACNGSDVRTPSCARLRVAKSQTAIIGLSVKTTEKGGPEVTTRAKVKGRNAHPGGSLGLPLALAVDPADIQDRDGARLVLARLLGRRLQLIGRPTTKLGVGQDGSVGAASSTQHTFQVLPRRWVVERTFGWLNLQRRLSKDYEALCETTETWIYIHRPHPAQTGPPSPFLDTL